MIPRSEEHSHNLLKLRKGVFASKLFLVLALVLTILGDAFAEGTKQLAPQPTDKVLIQPAPNGFAYYNGPADLRLHFRVENPESEQVFLGFSIQS